MLEPQEPLLECKRETSPAGDAQPPQAIHSQCSPAGNNYRFRSPALPKRVKIKQPSQPGAPGNSRVVRLDFVTTRGKARQRHEPSGGKRPEFLKDQVRPLGTTCQGPDLLGISSPLPAPGILIVIAVATVLPVQANPPPPSSSSSPFPGAISPEHRGMTGE